VHIAHAAKAGLMAMLDIDSSVNVSNPSTASARFMVDSWGVGVESGFTLAKKRRCQRGSPSRASVRPLSWPTGDRTLLRFAGQCVCSAGAALRKNPIRDYDLPAISRPTWRRSTARKPMAGNDARSTGTLLLTRNAALDLRRIHARSRRAWGDDVADRYLADLYAIMADAAVNPEKGRLRQHRSTPFLMVSARHIT